MTSRTALEAEGRGGRGSSRDGGGAAGKQYLGNVDVHVSHTALLLFTASAFRH